jgi:hypothetical protein
MIMVGVVLMRITDMLIGWVLGQMLGWIEGRGWQ